jgi:hypothetical protein
MPEDLEKARRRRLRAEYKARERAEERERLGLTREQFEDLSEYLEEALEREPCDHTLRHSVAWAQSRGLDPERVTAGLEALGGFCDDEVLWNIEPDEIF